MRKKDAARQAQGIDSVRRSAPVLDPPPEKAPTAPKADPVAGMGPENVAVRLEQEADGAAELVVRYRGPLADRSGLLVRFGERRDGRDWVEPRDVPMTTTGSEAWVAIFCERTATLEGGCFAFHAEKVGPSIVQTWDNAGHEFGYYAFDARTGRVEAR